ncbi:MAG: SCO family protein [Burkholderiales bacterium]|nr:MAG: SCO family protein [Burkholderiales bacterium]
MPEPRRRLLQAFAATAAVAAWPARQPQAFARHGRIEPAEPVPDLTVLRDDGARLPLERQLRGRITALHFMFTGCTSTCPIQGATFARVQALLGPQRAERLQLLSVSVDALGDDPASLARWRAALSAGPRWRAAVPIAAHGTRLLDWASAGGRSGADVHATQVLLIDERARLVFRSVDLPDARQVADLLVSLEASSRG